MRLKESDKLFLSMWLESNMNTRLNHNIIEKLTQSSSLTFYQVCDYLRAEKALIKKRINSE
jgi:hypothetical protein